MSTTTDILVQQLLKEVQEMKQGLGLNSTPATEDNGRWTVAKYDNYLLKKYAKRKLKK